MMKNRTMLQLRISPCSLDQGQLNYKGVFV